MDFWVFVFNALENIERVPLKSYDEFRKIETSVRQHVVMTTPHVAFETFTNAVPGYSTHMIRFRWDSGLHGRLPSESWGSVLLPWILLRGRDVPSDTEEVARSRVSSGLSENFHLWLSSNRRWLWEPYD